jgi:hypothetical protein
VTGPPSWRAPMKPYSCAWLAAAGAAIVSIPSHAEYWGEKSSDLHS